MEPYDFGEFGADWQVRSCKANECDTNAFSEDTLTTKEGKYSKIIRSLHGICAEIFESTDGECLRKILKEDLTAGEYKLLEEIIDGPKR